MTYLRGISGGLFWGLWHCSASYFQAHIIHSGGSRTLVRLADTLEKTEYLEIPEYLENPAYLKNSKYLETPEHLENPEYMKTPRLVSHI
ncbi:hypothetical protein M8J75_016226 [Diaphorina citri]|nr:hypothetical protein M8J75_016226 [Diaphorina citri]